MMSLILLATLLLAIVFGKSISIIAILGVCFPISVVEENFAVDDSMIWGLISYTLLVIGLTVAILWAFGRLA